MSLYDKVHFCCSLLTSVVPQCCCIVKRWIYACILFCLRMVGLFSKLWKAEPVAYEQIHLPTSLNSYPCFWGKHLLESLLPSNHSKVSGNIWVLLRDRQQLMPGWREPSEWRLLAAWPEPCLCWQQSLVSLADSQLKCESSLSSYVSQACLNGVSLLLPTFTCCRFALKNPCDCYDWGSKFWKASLKACGL